MRVSSTRERETEDKQIKKKKKRQGNSTYDNCYEEREKKRKQKASQVDRIRSHQKAVFHKVTRKHFTSRPFSAIKVMIINLYWTP